MPDPNPGAPDHTAAYRSTLDPRWRKVLIHAGIAVGLSLVLVLTGTSGPVAAKFPIDNFTNVDDTATVTPSGRNVAVSGSVECTEGIAEIRVTVLQGPTEATGRTHARCLGDDEIQSWTIHATTRGSDAFDVRRPVRVDAWAVTRFRGERTDGPLEWTNERVTLTRH